MGFRIYRIRFVVQTAKLGENKNEEKIRKKRIKRGV